MTTQLSQDNVLAELDQTQALCQRLMKTPHYAKMGEIGIYAIVNKAKSMGVNPLDALNGSFYFVQGKVEMSGQSMLALIRSRGHSVSMDPKSTDTKVIMFGKRCDNGDSWRAEFSVEDAKRQGIYRNQWEKMPRVMCMWRCVSQLGRFLFSDILKGVYVQGEIGDAVSFDTPVYYEEKKDANSEIKEISVEIKTQTITKEMAEELRLTLDYCSPEYQETVNSFLKRAKIDDLSSIPMETYPKLLERAKREEKAFNDKIQNMDVVQMSEDSVDGSKNE